MKRQDVLLWVVLILLVVILGKVMSADRGPRESQLTQSDRQRDYAAALKANQLYTQAAEAYDAYVAVGALPDSEKAKIDFNTGEMLLDQVGDIERALAHFVRVTDLYDGVDPALLKEARKHAAECLEKLGRAGAAERQLVESARLKSPTSSEEALVEEKDILASIGARVRITRTDFEQAWKDLPAQVREQQFPGNEGREKFLQELLSMRLFAEAARRKGLDRDPDFRRRLRDFEDSFLMSKLFEEEVSAKVTLPDSDLKLYYEAHREHYSDPESVEVAHIQTADASGCLAAKAAIEAGSSFEQAAKAFSLDARTRENGGRLGKIAKARVPGERDKPFDPFDVPVPGLGRERSLVEAAFALTEIGATTGPIRSERGHHLIRLLAREDIKQKTLEECRPQVEAELRAERERERRTALVADLMKAHDVKVYLKRLAEP
ncbi:MAG: Foldase protein PrsA [bacterium]|nr:Foldase protein PrsA [bacterium]